MALDSTHPKYVLSIEDWTLMRDCYAGERVVKAKGLKYLPATPGQLLDKMDKATDLGSKAYEAYKTRAVFHDYVSDAVESYIGLLHQKPAVFELPDGMQDMEQKATINGESLQTLLRRINEQQLVTGRLGLFLDLPVAPDQTNPLPYIAMYVGEAVRNWDDSDDNVGENSLNFVVLDESSEERQVDFNWIAVEKYRVLLLGQVEDGTRDPNETSEEQDKQETTAQAGERVYTYGVFYKRDTNSIDTSKMKAPMLRGAKLNEIPFVFINSKDIVADPDNPPLLGLGQLSMTIYRGEADYRHHLFMQGQDTLVVIGGIKPGSGADPLDDTVRVGAGARLDVDMGGDAKYIGVNSTGLSEVRVAIENDKKRAEAKAGSLATANNAGQKESGEALGIRLAAQTATLMQIALSGAAGLEKLLKIAARWKGLDESKVKVTPNLEFVDIPVDGKTFVDLMSARTMGAPISLESIHEVALERGITKFTFEDEMDKIMEEDAGRASANKKLGLDPTGQVIPEPQPNPNNPDDPNAPPARGNRPASA